MKELTVHCNAVYFYSLWYAPMCPPSSVLDVWFTILYNTILHLQFTLAAHFCLFIVHWRCSLSFSQWLLVNPPHPHPTQSITSGLGTFMISEPVSEIFGKVSQSVLLSFLCLVTLWCHSHWLITSTRILILCRYFMIKNICGQCWHYVTHCRLDNLPEIFD